MADATAQDLSPYPYPELPTEVNGYAIPDQDAIRARFGYGRVDLSRRMGVLFVTLEAEESIAVMPVDGNTQPLGLMHGGAYCVLGETLGSLSANAHSMPDRFALGVDINATHTGSATSGFVTGVCRSIHLGRTVAVHEIVVFDERGRRCSTIRMTNALRERA
ncbi:MAG: hotdog fold thioesterase [Pseudoclavibacter sp.]